MLHYLIRELKIELYWLLRKAKRRWHLDTPTGVMGIIALFSGLALFIVLGQGIAIIIRTSIPWVKGSTVGALYWTSIGFALKASFIILLFVTSFILYLWLKFYYRR